MATKQLARSDRPAVAKRTAPTTAAGERGRPDDRPTRAIALAQHDGLDQRLVKPRDVLELQSLVSNQTVLRLLAARRQPTALPTAGNAVSTVQRDPTTVDAKAADLAHDELILSSDPAYADEKFLAWFRDEVKKKVESWGLTFDGSAVYLKKVKIDSAATKAVLLKWPAGWGTQPTTQKIPFSLEPIDAHAALTGVHALKGWSKLSAADQGILDSMLGGETNQLSDSARSRLRDMFVALKAKSDTDQAKALSALIQDKDAIPAVVAEEVSSPKVGYTLDGPTVEKNFAFKGKTADAEKWVVKFKDGVDVPIFSPKAPEAGYHNHTVQQTADAAAYLAKSVRSLITQIVLNAVVNPDDAYWAAEYKRPDFHSYMTAGVAGVVTIYPDKATKPLPSENYMRGTMAHETGHTWSYKTWGEDKSKGKWVDWKQAMDQDKVSVSGYAKASIAEDVAETIQVYATTKGSPRFEEYRRIVPHRFAILDAEYK